MAHSDLEKLTKPTSKQYELLDIIGVNHRPHPYTITPKHCISRFITADTIREAEKRGAKCGVQGCNLPYDEHTCDTVLSLKMLVSEDELDRDELGTYLKSLETQLKELKIDGVIFVDYSGKEEK